MKIALLGAESTGKSTLAEAMASHLRAAGHPARAVPEVLRAWCLREGREPRPEEQFAIAREQEQCVEEACTQAGIVVADTSALMVAIYAARLHDNDPLYRYAVQRQRAYDITLVMGLDLPWVPDGLHRASVQVRDAVDACLRAELVRAGLAYRVIYGTGPQRLAHALAAANVAPQASGDALPDTGSRAVAEAGKWVWSCEKCSDPECEHRLFSRMLPRGK